MENPNQQNQPTDPNWWQPFFEGPFGRLQVGGAFEPDSAAEAHLIQTWLNLTPGAKILDAPSGDGRIARELARRGFNVTGIDFNPKVIEAGKALAKAQDLSIHFSTGDIRDLPFDKEFDAAVSWWSSFGYFNDDDNARYLAGLWRALKPGGRLVLDLLVAESLYTFHQQRGWHEHTTKEGTVRVLEQRELDLEAGRIVSEWTFLFKDREETQRVSIRVPTYHELCNDLKQAGFTAFTGYERPSGKPFKLGSPRL
ncbi:MAG TPA: class I SAM-dependent methyltransferase [Polyangiaceae bacterium]|nr:class I SAM-dependent methyltransferase [Polyangiaceae bacterium]